MATGPAAAAAANAATAAARLEAHVRRCFELADAGASALGEGALAMEGMSGAKTRHLLNNLWAPRGVGWGGAAVCTVWLHKKRA
jgi:hypothetical protein